MTGPARQRADAYNLPRKPMRAYLTSAASLTAGSLLLGLAIAATAVSIKVVEAMPVAG